MKSTPKDKTVIQNMFIYPNCVSENEEMQFRFNDGNMKSVQSEDTQDYIKIQPLKSRVFFYSSSDDDTDDITDKRDDGTDLDPLFDHHTAHIHINSAVDNKIAMYGDGTSHPMTGLAHTPVDRHYHNTEMIECEQGSTNICNEKMIEVESNMDDSHIHHNIVDVNYILDKTSNNLKEDSKMQLQHVKFSDEVNGDMCITYKPYDVEKRVEDIDICSHAKDTESDFRDHVYIHNDIKSDIHDSDMASMDTDLDISPRNTKYDITIKQGHDLKDMECRMTDREYESEDRCNKDMVSVNFDFYNGIPIHHEDTSCMKHYADETSSFKDVISKKHQEIDLKPQLDVIINCKESYMILQVVFADYSTLLLTLIILWNHVTRPPDRMPIVAFTPCEVPDETLRLTGVIEADSAYLLHLSIPDQSVDHVRDLTKQIGTDYTSSLRWLTCTCQSTVIRVPFSQLEPSGDCDPRYVTREDFLQAHDRLLGIHHGPLYNMWNHFPRPPEMCMSLLQ